MSDVRVKHFTLPTIVFLSNLLFRLTDVAIGAPFEGEDGSGSVYIYHGSHNGINPNYKQVQEVGVCV